MSGVFMEGNLGAVSHGGGLKVGRILVVIN